MSAPFAANFLANLEDDFPTNNASIDGLTSRSGLTWHSGVFDSLSTSRLGVSGNILISTATAGNFQNASLIGPWGPSLRAMVTFATDVGDGTQLYRFWFRTPYTSFPATFSGSSAYWIECVRTGGANGGSIDLIQVISGATSTLADGAGSGATGIFDWGAGDRIAFAVDEANGGTLVTALRVPNGSNTPVAMVSWFDTNASRQTAAGGLIIEINVDQWNNDDLRIMTVPNPTATRMYFPESTVLPTNISLVARDAGWEKSTNEVVRYWARSKLKTTMATQTVVGNASANTDVIARRYVSDPLVEQLIHGHFRAVVRVAETLAANNVRAQMTLKVISNDGGTVRATLIAMDTGALSNEANTSLRSLRFPRGTTTTGFLMTPYYCAQGDRLLLEIGYRNASNTANNTMSWGDDAAADLDDTELDTGADNPWAEFSQGVQFIPSPHDIWLPPPLLIPRGYPLNPSRR